MKIIQTNIFGENEEVLVKTETGQIKRNTDKGKIFLKLLAPGLSLMSKPIQDNTDLIERISKIEEWFCSMSGGDNFIITLEAVRISERQARRLLKEYKRKKDNEPS